jgi:uncharacterized protein YhaN
MVHVMSEVKRFKASDLHVACCGDTIVVNAEDYDARDHAAAVYFDSWKRTEQELDAQRLRADTAEAELAIIRPERDLYKASSEALEDQWNAAEKRIADGIAYVQKLVDCSKNQDSVATGYLSDILSALNQKSEGVSHG